MVEEIDSIDKEAIHFQTRQRKFRMTPQARAREISLVNQTSPESIPLLRELGQQFREACIEFNNK